MARLTTIVAGAVGTALAIVSPTIIGVLSIFYTLLGVSLFVPILGGLYVRARDDRRRAGVDCVRAWRACCSCRSRPAARGYGMWTPALIGLMAASVAFVIVLAAGAARSACCRADRDDQKKPQQISAEECSAVFANRRFFRIVMDGGW